MTLEMAAVWSAAVEIEQQYWVENPGGLKSQLVVPSSTEEWVTEF
jgi:hypothetical protein